MKRLVLLLLIPFMAFSQTREQMNLLLLNSGRSPKLITSSVTNGTITASAYVPQGTSKTFTFTANEHYTLTLLSIDGLANTDSLTTYTFKNVNRTHTIAVTFSLKTWNLVVATPTNGTISPGTTIKDEGTSQAFIITPNSGYVIDSLKIDGVRDSVRADTAYTYTFTNITASHTVSCSFRQVLIGPAVYNGDLETWTTPTQPALWNNQVSAGNTISDTSGSYSGSHAAYFRNTGDITTLYTQDNFMAVGKIYKLTFMAKQTAGSPTFVGRLGDNALIISPTTSWVKYEIVGACTGEGVLRLYNVSGNSGAIIDDVQLFEVR